MPGAGGITTFSSGAPTLAVANDGGKTTAARANLTRLVAPEAIKPASLDQPFYVLAWPSLAPETVLAATLEKAAPYPIRIEWGQYLLETALERGNAIPLVTGDAALPGSLTSLLSDVLTYSLSAGRPLFRRKVGNKKQTASNEAICSGGEGSRRKPAGCGMR